MMHNILGIIKMNLAFSGIRSGGVNWTELGLPAPLGVPDLWGVSMPLLGVPDLTGVAIPLPLGVTALLGVMLQFRLSGGFGGPFSGGLFSAPGGCTVPGFLLLSIKVLPKVFYF